MFGRCRKSSRISSSPATPLSNGPGLPPCGRRGRGRSHSPQRRAGNHEGAQDQGRSKKSARDYEKIANGLEYGTFENERFVVNEIETARAKNELETLSPRVFAFGSELIIREVNGKGLDYQLMVGMIEVCERDYLVGPEAAWRFRRLALNDQRYNDEIFNRQVRKGEITWFKKAPSQEHLKKRKQEDYRTSATFWTADSERRVFRLVDLIQ